MPQPNKIYTHFPNDKFEIPCVGDSTECSRVCLCGGCHGELHFHLYIYSHYSPIGCIISFDDIFGNRLCVCIACFLFFLFRPYLFHYYFFFVLFFHRAFLIYSLYSHTSLVPSRFTFLSSFHSFPAFLRFSLSLSHRVIVYYTIIGYLDYYMVLSWPVIIRFISSLLSIVAVYVLIVYIVHAVVLLRLHDFCFPIRYSN